MRLCKVGVSSPCCQLLTTEQELLDCKARCDAATGMVSILQEERVKLSAVHTRKIDELIQGNTWKQQWEMARSHKENDTGPRQIIEVFLLRKHQRSLPF